MVYGLNIIFICFKAFITTWKKKQKNMLLSQKTWD